jgi:hypothetical protein
VNNIVQLGDSSIHIPVPVVESNDNLPGLWVNRNDARLLIWAGRGRHGGCARP